MTRSRDVADTQDNLGGAVAPWVSGKNFIINGGIDVWQRGTSIAAQQIGFNYVADRWGASCNASGAATVSRQATGDTTNLPFIQYCARFQRTAGNTATGIQYFNQPIETINSIPLAGKTVTVSFYARAGANFSASSNLLTAQLIWGTGTDQNYLGVWTGGGTVLTVSATLTTTWQRFSATATVPVTANELTLPFTYTPTGTAGANDYYEVTGVQLELGSVATPFARAGGSIGGELALCQRYFVRRGSESALYAYYGNGDANSATEAKILMTMPVTMRVAPSLSCPGIASMALQQGSVFAPASAIALDMTTSWSVGFRVTVGGGLTNGYGCRFLSNNSTSTFVDFSSEL